MALDGIVIANVVYELRNVLIGGRINKIAQPERDELLLTIKGTDREVYKLFLSAGIYAIDISDRAYQANPMTAPNFCMCFVSILITENFDITQRSRKNCFF